MSAAPLVADAALPRHHARGGALVEVAVGILLRADGCFLLTSRPAGKTYAGYWEFPGGKLEAGEQVADALARELHEELGLIVQPADVAPWRELKVDYPHGLVHLHFCKVRRWAGRLQMRERQDFSWTRLPVAVQPILPGTVPVLEWLRAEGCGA